MVLGHFIWKANTELNQNSTHKSKNQRNFSFLTITSQRQERINQHIHVFYHEVGLELITESRFVLQLQVFKRVLMQQNTFDSLLSELQNHFELDSERYHSLTAFSVAREIKHHNNCNIRENTLLSNCLAHNVYPNLFFHKDKSSYSYLNSSAGLSVGDNCPDVATSMESVDYRLESLMI